MNRQQVLSHLRQAQEAIEKMVTEIEQDREYDDVVFELDMQHLYHHVNTAWNSRKASDSEIEPVSDANFNLWSRFPADLPMMQVE